MDLKLPESDEKSALPALSSGLPVPHSDLLAKYMAEIRHYPLLDPKEEQALALEYQKSKDPEAAFKLITSNLRLVVKIAYEYRRSWTNLLDLIQEGNIGLAQALEKFDPLRGLRFTSYAQYWIRAYILQYIMNNISLVRIGTTRSGRKLFYQLQKERNKLLAQGIVPGPRLLAERLDVPEEEVERVSARLAHRDLSLDQPAQNDNEGRSVSELLSDENEIDPEQAVAASEAAVHLRKALDAFGRTIRDERERAIWRRRLLNVNGTPVSLSELGAEFGVSKERIRQLEERLKGRARDFLAKRLGSDVDVLL